MENNTRIKTFIRNKKFKGSISLLITGDEEGIAINGTKKVVEYLKKKKEKIQDIILKTILAIMITALCAGVVTVLALIAKKKGII